MYRVLKKFDDMRFLGFEIWEFSGRSLFTDYGPLFFKEVILRHLFRTTSGLIKYRRYISSRDKKAEVECLSSEFFTQFGDFMVKGDGELLLAVGFCQKPIEISGISKECPSGRFNHNCLYLDASGSSERVLWKNEVSSTDKKLPIKSVMGKSVSGRSKRDSEAFMDLQKKEVIHKEMFEACRSCEIRRIATRALKGGMEFYIMTSARDIAEDILIPSIRWGKFKKGIFLLCPYSSHAIIAPLLICGIDSVLVKYSSGNCLNYNYFINADKGIKASRTSISYFGNKKLNYLVDKCRELRVKDGGEPVISWRKSGNFYMPVGERQV